MNEELIGLIPAAGKGVRLGLPYPKELYPVIRDNQSFVTITTNPLHSTWSII